MVVLGIGIECWIIGKMHIIERSNMMQKSIIAFMNAYSSGKSGADKAFIEIFKRLKNARCTVVTSRLGKNLCTKENLTASYLTTSEEKEFNHAVIIYLQRIVRAVLIVLHLPLYELIYSTSDSLPDTLPALIYKLRNKKSRWIGKIFHLIPSERKISYLAQKLSFFLIKKFADVIIVDNKLLKEKLLQIGFPKNKLTVNYLGVDQTSLSNIAPSAKKYDATFMARLHKSKGIFDLISIWHKVTRTMIHAKLAVIGLGDKSTIAKLQKAIVDSGLDRNVEILGYLEDDEAFSRIKSSRVFLYPSREEGFGMVIAEVMTSKVPVIAYDLPAYHHTFKRGIITVPLGKIEIFSEKFLSLLQNEAERKKIMRNALIISKKFSWESTVKKELQLMSV